MVRRHRHQGSRLIAAVWHSTSGALALAVGLAGLVAVASERPALARISQYHRISLANVWGVPPQQGVTLGARGYIDDSCINQLLLPCFSASEPFRTRPEVTAQAIAMHYLAAMRTGDWSNIDWEVGPEPSSSAASSDPAPQVAGEGPIDPCEKGKTGYRVDTNKWRIDIVADKSTILEVKRWKGSQTPAEVTNQLNCYTGFAARRGVRFGLNSDLFSVGWAVPFLLGNYNPTSIVNCVWAPQPGHIYFAPITDPAVPSKCRVPVMAGILAAGAAWAGAQDYIRRKTPAQLEPVYQQRPAGVTSYTASALQDPLQPRSLTLAFGNGASQSFTVPQGSGYASTVFSTSFSAGRYVQTATLGGSLSAAAAPSGAAAPNAAATVGPLISQAVTDVCPSGASTCTGIGVEDIGDEWQGLAGGETGVLGKLTIGTNNTSCGGGNWNGFERGLVTFRSDVGANWIQGAIQSKWAGLNYECGVLGFIASDPFAGVKAGGTVQNFQGGVVYSSGAGTFVVNGAMLTKYGQLGYEGGFLGYPTSDAFNGKKAGGIVQNFEGGVLYSTSAGTFYVRGAILGRYAARGYETGYGYPTSDENPTSCRGGTWASFEAGLIISGPTSGAWAVQGAIFAKWQSLGYECSYLGFPISDELTSPGPPPWYSGDNGQLQYFQGSSIFWNRYSGQSFAFGEGGGASGYYANADWSQLLMTRPDQTINFDWGYGSPGPSVPVDHFNVQWRTRLWVPADGYYTFYTLSDDGVQLAVCPSELGYACGSSPFVINNWTQHPQTENTSPALFLKRGSHHLDLFYFEATGGATIQLLWSGPGISKQVISRANLDPTLIGPPSLAASAATGSATSAAGNSAAAGGSTEKLGTPPQGRPAQTAVGSTTTSPPSTRPTGSSTTAATAPATTGPLNSTPTTSTTSKTSPGSSTTMVAAATTSSPPTAGPTVTSVSPTTRR